MSAPPFRPWERRRDWAIMSAALAAVFFWRLHYLSLIDPDEAHYGRLTQEMAGANSWLVPLLDGAPHIDKPALFHWLQIAAIALFGETPFAMRLPTALAAVALFWVVWWAGRQLFDTETGNIASLMFATVPLTFALANVAVFDMLFAAALFGTVACLLVGAVRRRRGVEYAGWGLLALAVMIKGPVGGALIVIYGAALAVPADTRALVAGLQWARGLLLAAALASPWFIAMWLRFGEHFIQTYVFAGNLYYFTSPPNFSSRNSGWTFYLRVFAGAFFPWSLIVVTRGIGALRTRAARQAWPVAERALWIWLAVVIGFFTLAQFKLDPYIYPTAPAACLIAARGWGEVGRRGAPARGTIYLVAAVVILAGAVGSVVLFRINLGVPAAAVVFPAGLIVAGGMMLMQLVRADAPGPLAAVLVATLGFGYWSVTMFGFPILERSRPTPSLGRWIVRNVPEATPVGLHRVTDWLSSARYYSKRRVVLLPTDEDVQRFVEEHPAAVVFMLRDHYDGMRSRGVALRALVGGPAIVGRSGRYIRQQVWGRLILAGNPGATEPAVLTDDDRQVLARER